MSIILAICLLGFHTPSMRYTCSPVCDLSQNIIKLTNMRAVKASDKVSIRTAQAERPHTPGKSLLLPAATDMASSVLGV